MAWGKVLKRKKGKKIQNLKKFKKQNKKEEKLVPLYRDALKL
jgi:hypothetical protein